MESEPTVREQSEPRDGKIAQWPRADYFFINGKSSKLKPLPLCASCSCGFIAGNGNGFRSSLPPRAPAHLLGRQLELVRDVAESLRQWKERSGVVPEIRAAGW